MAKNEGVCEEKKMDLKIYRKVKEKVRLWVTRWNLRLDKLKEKKEKKRRKQKKESENKVRLKVRGDKTQVKLYQNNRKNNMSRKERQIIRRTIYKRAKKNSKS